LRATRRPQASQFSALSLSLAGDSSATFYFLSPGSACQLAGRFLFPARAISAVRGQTFCSRLCSHAMTLSLA
jgi:hypothetical protein